MPKMQRHGGLLNTSVGLHEVSPTRTIYNVFEYDLNKMFHTYGLGLLDTI